MDEQQDVQSAPSTDTQVEGAEAQIPAQEEAEVESSTQEVKPEVKDDRPVENVAWEAKRKLDEVVPALQNEIRELKSIIQSNQQPQQPRYTRAQLMAYAADPTTTTEQRLWAYTEVDKMEKEERRKEYEALVSSTQKRTEGENRKAQAAQWVANTFPDTVIKDQIGNVVGWNNQSVLLMRANEYMAKNENLRNDPEGFMAAVKMAAFDLGVNSSKKLDRTIGQLRKEQKKQLASTGGSKVTENPAMTQKSRLSKLQEEYGKTGNPAVFAEIVKLRGLNPFV